MPRNVDLDSVRFSMFNNQRDIVDATSGTKIKPSTSWGQKAAYVAAATFHHNFGRGWGYDAISSRTPSDWPRCLGSSSRSGRQNGRTAELT
jgi:hypothetical protein